MRQILLSDHLALKSFENPENSDKSLCMNGSLNYTHKEVECYSFLGLERGRGGDVGGYN